MLKYVKETKLYIYLFVLAFVLKNKIEVDDLGSHCFPFKIIYCAIASNSTCLEKTCSSP